MVANELKETRMVIFSDTHGIKKVMKNVIINHGPFDILLHLGDGVRDGMAVSKELDITFTWVCGNEDYGVNGKEKHLLHFNPWSLLLFHGYQMDLNPFQSKAIWETHYNEMYHMAKEQNASLLLFGHTHQPLLKKVNNILLCNPGSPTFQYAKSSPSSFAILNARKSELEVSLLKQGDNDQWEIYESDKITLAPD